MIPIHIFGQHKPGVPCFLRGRRPLFFLGIILVLCSSSSAQVDTASISGVITDQSGAIIVGADVRVTNSDTNVTSEVTSNQSGVYLITGLKPGRYRIKVAKEGFKGIDLTDLILNVQDSVNRNFTLQVGSASETVSVEGNGLQVNTQDASVSTVIDRNFVEKLPLNGRSFNTLLELTPGVVIAQTNSYGTGQFSIAGQRTSGNSFVVDGVSANFGVSPAAAVGTAGGSAQAFSALGGTSSLVSVEALQEFRIDTSSFAPEFGRTPGGQVILSTRSGTNNFHAEIFNYFRNTVLDANDWFALKARQPRAAEHHNDFGGFLGGPIWKDRTFVFLSYEGARLDLPGTRVIQVPYINANGSCVAPAAIAPFLEAYPKPNGPVSTATCTGQFTGNYSNPAALNAGSVRLDHTISRRFAIFGRYNEAPSEVGVRADSLSEIKTTQVGTRTLTIGTAMTLNSSMSNALRGNYSLQSSSLVNGLDSLGGAIPPSLSVLAPNLAGAANANINFETFDTFTAIRVGPQAKNRSTQLNFADDFVLLRGAHQMKFGADYRGIFLDLHPSSILFYYVSSVPNFLSTSQADFGIQGISGKPSKLYFPSTSLYAQDSWRIAPRATLTYGVRWELDPAPSGRDATTIAAWRNVTNPAALSLAAPGSALWSTTYTNFGPRVGLAYGLTDNGDFVLRVGAGVFFDLGTDAVGYLGSVFPNSATSFSPPASLPLSDATPYLPTLSTQPPYPDGTTGYTPDLKLPRSYQWDVALEKSLAGQQALSVTYVGQAGRDVLRQEGINQPNPNFQGAFLLTGNNARSNYNALQVQYRRSVAHGLQALLNYTWSHSLDNASDDTVIATAISSSVISTANDYASSSFDVRNSFSGAISYTIPTASAHGPLSVLTRNWSVQALAVARSGLPFNGQVLTTTIGGAFPRPNLTGQPFWLSGSQYPGGMALNPSAFVIPPAGQQGTEGRNDIRGFGLTQVDFSVGKEFQIAERLRLHFRTDAFNILNHPSFANPVAYVGLGPAFLQSMSMLNKGLGGLNPLFQEGGPRSLQLSLKLAF